MNKQTNGLRQMRSLFVLPVLTDIVNTSLTSGVFSMDLKQAIVSPILKKNNLDCNELNNYRPRPVSNIGFSGKVIERAAILQVNEYIQANNLDEPFLSAYTNKHSTETAFLKVKNDTTQALDHNRAAFLVAFDLSLLPSMPLTMTSFFTAWNMALVSRVQYTGGSNLTLLAASLELLLEVPGDAVCAIFRLSSSVEELRLWLANNMLKLNDSKAEVFIAASPQNMNRLSNTTIQIGSATITPSSTIKKLGVTFDTAMTMSVYVTSLCKSINFLLWNLARIRRFLDRDACSNAMRALVLSKLDYANALLLGSKNKDVARLQRLQNRAARIVFQVPRRHSTSLLLNTLHWLPLDKRIKLKTLLYIFKALNDLSPVYLKDCIATHVPSREGLQSSRDVTRLSIPKSSRRIGD
ncbi:uncharacterized protein LOC117302569 [Asterias rubens]|uniref:uncharacterized protein LOC117302569 n=1 Tax=Asterias rubens TaxID=7604 RepID=UPI001455559F|nr:uncharacterized protein LOC117302569 [Asterias rubens]